MITAQFLFLKAYVPAVLAARPAEEAPARSVPLPPESV